MQLSLPKRSVAEFVGTFWLVFGGCGSAVLAATFPNVGIGFLGVALAFGLTLLTMAYAIGHISGCHLNPAVSIGLVAARRFPLSELPAYVFAQLVGSIVGAAVLYVIATGREGFDLSGGFAANGHGIHSPGGYSRRMLDCRNCLDLHVPAHYFGSDHPPGTSGTRAYCHWIWIDSDSADRNSGQQCVSQSRAKYRTCALRRRVGSGATVAVLACSHNGCCIGRTGLSCIHVRVGTGSSPS